MNTRSYLLAAFKIHDAVMVIVCFALALSLAEGRRLIDTNAAAVLSMQLELYKFLALLVIAWISHLILTGFGLYGSKRFEVWYREPIDLLMAMAVVTAVAMASAWTAGFSMRAPSLVGALFFGLGYAAMLSFRIALRRLLKWIRRAGRNLNHVLIVGTNCRAHRAAGEIASRPELGCRLVGFVDRQWHEPDLADGGHRLVSTFDTLRCFLRENVVDEVIICIPVKSLYDRAAQVVDACQEQGVSVRFMPDIFADASNGFEDFSVVSSVLLNTQGPATSIKRASDVLIAAMLLTLFAPLLACVALLIKATSDGPVLFVQERVGLNKRRFRLYKFRTMTADAEGRRAELAHLNETAGPTFKIGNDPRVTGVGRILRRTSIDELPQLINVLFGDMSLVGPRPLPVLDYAGFSSDRHRKRLSVRPGITCLWQVQGRSAIPFERWMELDLKYVDQWSLWLDLKILILTIPAVIKAAGAS
jgi:exopolysaccharide biosynthesis polyprenyl glycosylphosphotransferase